MLSEENIENNSLNFNQIEFIENEKENENYQQKFEIIENVAYYQYPENGQ